MKLNSSGLAQWVVKINGTNIEAGQNNKALAVTVDDSNGNVYVTGYVHNTRGDIFVNAYSITSALLWTKNFTGQSGTSYGSSIALDSIGNPIIAGVWSGGQIDFGGGIQYNVSGGLDGFLLKLSKTDGS